MASPPLSGIGSSPTISKATVAIETNLWLAFQVPNISKAVQFTLGRVNVIEPTLFESEEKTSKDLHGRIQETIEPFKTVKPEDVNSREAALLDLGETHKVTAKAAFLGHG
ncbi:hypothetical protein FZEAL_43 [Fusarium zealandicum]|uniref:Uncharacterized protein n=1 Tax=Fusarium zealandicum TaxID=1053134 RepID=A0A8H4XRB4_9HYPO|nr:hypothetical protein FZEAL_43 [Fusarium zealandicum]